MKIVNLLTFRVRLILFFVSFFLLNHYYYVFYKTHIFKVIINGDEVNFTGVDDFIPPFVNIVSDFFVSPDYKIMTCGIRKSMSQLAENTVCSLYDVDAFMEGKLELNATWNSNRPCHHEDPLFRNVSLNLLKDPELTKFAFIRDPFDRFISFYLDKCVREENCWECKSDMRCIVKTAYEKLKVLQNQKESLPPATYIEMHVAPLSWNCNFDKDLAEWQLIMIGADLEKRKMANLQLSNILKSHNVSDQVLEKLQEESLVGETHHSTHKSSKRIRAEEQVKNDIVVRDYLHKMFFFDYLIFNFPRDPLDSKYQTDFWTLPGDKE